MTIGVTGKICSGKDTFIAKTFPKSAYFVIDADEIGHRTLKEKKEEIIKEFGKSVVREDGEIDRKALREIVFSDSSKMKKLNLITHPDIKEKILTLVEEAREKNLIPVINAALLERVGLDEICERIYLLTAPYEVRLERAKKDRALSEETFLRIEREQTDIGEKIRGREGVILVESS